MRYEHPTLKIKHTHGSTIKVTQSTQPLSLIFSCFSTKDWNYIFTWSQGLSIWNNFYGVSWKRRHDYLLVIRFPHRFIGFELPNQEGERRWDFQVRKGVPSSNVFSNTFIWVASRSAEDMTGVGKFSFPLYHFLSLTNSRQRFPARDNKIWCIRIDWYQLSG